MEKCQLGIYKSGNLFRNHIYWRQTEIVTLLQEFMQGAKMSRGRVKRIPHLAFPPDHNTNNSPPIAMKL